MPCRALAGALLLAVAAAVQAQGWAPQHNVEIVVGSAPGGSNDRTARQVEKVIVENRLLGVPFTVVNKPGGSGNIAFTYVSQHAGDAHYLMIGTSPLISNRLTGQGALYYGDFTPIASLFNDYVVFAVNAASPMAAGNDLAQRLKKDSKSVSTGFAVALGSHNHIAVCLLIKALGGNPRELRAVVFKGAAEAVTALLGGHIDLIATAAGNAAPHVATGKMRVLAVAAPKRMGGVLAGVPTWREQGIDLVFGGWRSIMAPRGLTPAQIAYWEGVLRKATQTPDWRGDLEKNYWTDDFVTGAQFRKDLDKEYGDTRAILADLGLAKP
ncbi:MAG TPA: tripartite tricarboxylate transporter substrate binding protein [Burkholderiales bacterium]|nr:tripartite tricarboxylate transporter substrate binding protein [Burkholderiales bacterium]